MTLKKATIKDQIYELIKKRILNQTYQLGEKINMLALSQELSVSNTPIREALSMLERDGLVVVHPNAGPKVMTLDDRKFAEITQAVKVLMLGSYEVCVEGGLLPMLNADLEEKLLKQKLLPKSSTDYDFATAAMHFDECVLTAPENGTLRSLYDGLFCMMYLVVLYDHQHLDVDREANIREHEEILQASKNYDHPLVRELLMKHYNRTISA